MIIVNGKIRLTFSSSGFLVECHINRGTALDPLWASLPFNPLTKVFDGSHPLTQELRDWEAIHGTLDLSDRAPDPPPPPPLDWQSFRRAILRDKAYQRVANSSTDQRAVSRLELSAGIESENWAEVQQSWNAAIVATPIVKIALTTTEIATWNRLAFENAMPFSFALSGAAAGSMVLKS